MSDSISKQKVIDTLDFVDNALTDEVRTVENFKALLTECIKVLPSAENDGDLISRQAVENITWEEPSYTDPLNVLTEVREKVRALPSVENKGEWIKIKSGDKDFPESIVCSKCKNENSHLDFNEHGEPIGKVFVTSKFCPNCGADMRKAEKPETCKGCLEPCIMYEPDMRGCKNKVTERGE